MTADVCRERNIKVDEAGFERAMEDQRRRARESSGFGADYNALIKVDKRSEFSGYQHDEQQATIIALYKDGQPVDSLHTGDEGLVILDKTAFYAESGGQVGDTGVLTNDSAQFTVTDTQKYGQAIGHVGKVESGSLVVNHRIAAIVNSERRNAIRLNHSATHLLHAALRQVLGEHVSERLAGE